MNLFEVDRQSCNQDGICAAVCPAGLIDFQKGKHPEPIAGADELCIRCGHCVAVCPTGSLSHREIPIEECPPVQKELQLTAENCEHFLRSRRSIRVYKDKKVPVGDLEKLIETARYAPSGHNSQGVEWLVLGNRNELQNLSEIIADWMRWMISNLPDVALSMHMDRTLEGWESGRDVLLRGAPAVIVTHAEKNNLLAPAACTIALAYLELASTGMGLGCCWAGYFNAAATTFPPMMEALSLPEEHQCLGSMMVGYPKFSYYRLPSRKPPGITWRMS